jgi:hypothetical protein
MSTAGVFLAVGVAIQPRLLSSPATKRSPAMAACWIARPRGLSADVSMVMLVPSYPPARRCELPALFRRGVILTPRN